MYWLRKLVLAWMSGDDVDSHLDKMSALDKHLKNVTSTRIILALKQESLRQKSRNKGETVASASRSGPAPSNYNPTRRHQPQDGRPPLDQNLHCSHCSRGGHDLLSCFQALKILSQHKRQTPNTPSDSDPAPPKSALKKSVQAAKAGRTLVVTLGRSSDEDESDFNGSKVVFASSPKALFSAADFANGGPCSQKDCNLDSGCSVSMRPYLNHVHDPVSFPTCVLLADRSTIQATHKGNLTLPLSLNRSIPALFVPDLYKPLLSIAAICHCGLQVLFKKGGCDILAGDDGCLVGKGYRSNNLYYLPSSQAHTHPACNSIKYTSDNSLLGYHACLNHIGLQPLKLLLKLLHLQPLIMNKIDAQHCPVCIRSKMHQTAFKDRSAYRSMTPGLLIHLEVASFGTPSCEGFRYFVTFIDNCWKCAAAYPMKLKSHVFHFFKVFCAVFEKSGRYTIQSLQSNNGGKYLPN